MKFKRAAKILAADSPKSPFWPAYGSGRPGAHFPAGRPRPIRSLFPHLLRPAPLLLLLACSSNGSAPADPGEAARDRNAKRIDTADVTKKQEADAEFLMQATGNALLGIKLVKLAQQPGSADAMRAYGPRLVRQGLERLRALQSLAAAKQLAVPADLGEDAREAYHKVSTQAASPARDQALLKLLVKTQKRDEDAYDDLQDEAYDGDIRALAARYLPVVREQRKAAEEIKDQLK